MNTGLLYGIAAYLSWGVVPIFWKQIDHVPAFETMGHRVVWALPAFAVLVVARGRVAELRTAITDRRVIATMALSALLLATNWTTFIYAVNTERLLHASLGYFINPLVSVLLGMLVLRERLHPLEWVACALAAAGVVQMGLEAVEFPWIAFVVAVSFGLYGLIRKTARVEALAGSTLEVMMLAPIGAAYLLVLAAQGDGQLGHAEAATHGYLFATGIVTAVPLVWFIIAARRLRLATIGFLQYIAPTGQFLLAVIAFGEPFGGTQLRAFACIWTGLAVFSIARLRAARSM